MQKCHVGWISTLPDDLQLVMAEPVLLQDLNNYFVAPYGPL